MSGNRQAQISAPANKTRQKVTPMDKGEFAELLGLAEDSAARLGAAYEDTVSTAAARLTRLANTARRDTSCRANTISEIADMAFELRGEGASFGFDVVSQVADSLFRMTEKADGGIDRFTLKVVEMHALALNALLAGGSRSATDDAVAAQILAALAVAKNKTDV